MPVGKTAIESKPGSYEKIVTPFDWPENNTLIDIYLDDRATSEQLAAFLSSDHIYTDKHGVRYFGDIAVPSMLTHFLDAANDSVHGKTSDDMEHLVINPGQTSLYDRIMNLIADGQPSRAVVLIDNAVQAMTERNQEKTLSAIVDFWNVMTSNGFKAEADHLSGTLAILDQSPQLKKDEEKAAENDEKKKSVRPAKSDRKDEFLPVFVGGMLAETAEQAEMLRRLCAQRDMSRNGPG